MNNIVIKAENISKLYRLGEFSTGTLSHDLNRWFAKIRGKDDPFARIGEVNDRAKKGTSDFVWSLKDINFEIRQGESVGVIGRNGAGKSTLLKLLSRVTAPTTGLIKVKGRVASLLEVGTGFHPELTGRENIYLNGTILGMRKKEINKKLEGIIDFSGVERYIDTPVKRYSSGMYVRLAFAVAAYLDSEILIVDEVLAVGDAEFQKKCLGKLSEVSKGEGRTVLFVSHNMAAIQKFCSYGIFMKHGMIHNSGNITDVIGDYLRADAGNSTYAELDISSLTEQHKQLGYAQSVYIEDLQENPAQQIPVGKFWQVRIRFRINKQLEHFIIAIGCTTSNQVPLFTSFSKTMKIDPGEYEVVFKNDQLLLAPGNYAIAVGLSNFETAFHYVEEAINLEIADVKDETIKNDERLVRNTGVGILLNPFACSLIHKK